MCNDKGRNQITFSLFIMQYKFIVIIDEWDAIIREARHDAKVQSAYFNFLRELFKNGNFTPFAIAAAYMTGILPIRKDGSQSAISDFNEYAVLNPGRFSDYIQW